MPNPGDIARGADISRAPEHKYIWLLCAKCGRQRGWIEKAKKDPTPLCFKCSHFGKEWNASLLKQWYEDEKKSLADIGKLMGAPASTVHNILEKYNLPRRKLSEAAKLRHTNHPVPSGARSPLWRGGARNEAGYIIIRVPDDDPYVLMRKKDGYILEHRLVMARHIGRRLLPTEPVHHINGIRNDNRVENLQLLSRADHSIFNNLCLHCELRKEIRLLRWQIKELQAAVQGRLEEQTYETHP